MPRKTVVLELALKPPPPPPPLLNKNVALTRLDDNAYKKNYNGLWASVISYDPIRRAYQCAPAGMQPHIAPPRVHACMSVT